MAHGTPLSTTELSLSTLSIHADDELNTSSVTDVAPPIHVSTTFRYTNDLDKLIPLEDEDMDLTNPIHVYSRVSAPSSTRLEKILSVILKAPSITYSSGLAAFHAMLVRLRPNVIAITDGYHGCHGVVALLVRLYGLKVVPLADLAAWDAVGLGSGDVVHVETPINPTGEAVDLARYAALAKERGAWLSVDATFGPPPLQDPFVFGADFVMHSGTKYLGGHSDLLCGVLATKHADIWKGLWEDRIYLGSTLGNLEAWLGVRSVRTLEIRVKNQSAGAEKLVRWLDACVRDDASVAEEERLVVRKVVKRVQHGSLQALEEGTKDWVLKQMPNGFGPVFSFWADSAEMARRLPSKLQLFHHATSLGGVESLIEWRKMSDKGVDARLLRVSVGLESWEDLKSDFLRGFREVAVDLTDK